MVRRPAALGRSAFPPGGAFDGGRHAPVLRASPAIDVDGRRSHTWQSEQTPPVRGPSGGPSPEEYAPVARQLAYESVPTEPVSVAGGSAGLARMEFAAVGGLLSPQVPILRT